MPAKKSLGQHWLRDKETLLSIVQAAEVSGSDVILEIGPGQGALTSELISRAGRVVAVELDGDLAKKLPGQFPGKDLQVIHQDILQFDLNSLPKGYKVVANVPYYITSKIIKFLLESDNKPSLSVVLVQKEVAERLAAGPGDMSILAVSAQIFAEVTLGPVVPAELFLPSPKVDSQVVIIKTRLQPLVSEENSKHFFRVVKAGFSAKRKKLRASLAGGLHMSKTDADELLVKSKIDPSARAETLSLDDWIRLSNSTLS